MQAIIDPLMSSNLPELAAGSNNDTVLAITHKQAAPEGNCYTLAGKELCCSSIVTCHQLDQLIYDSLCSHQWSLQLKCQTERCCSPAISKAQVISLPAVIA